MDQIDDFLSFHSESQSTAEYLEKLSGGKGARKGTKKNNLSRAETQMLILFDFVL